MLLSFSFCAMSQTESMANQSIVDSKNELTYSVNLFQPDHSLNERLFGGTFFYKRAFKRNFYLRAGLKKPEIVRVQMVDPCYGQPWPDARRTRLESSLGVERRFDLSKRLHGYLGADVQWNFFNLNTTAYHKCSYSLITRTNALSFAIPMGLQYNINSRFLALGEFRPKLRIHATHFGVETPSKSANDIRLGIGLRF